MGGDRDDEEPTEAPEEAAPVDDATGTADDDPDEEGSPDEGTATPEDDPNGMGEPEGTSVGEDDGTGGGSEVPSEGDAAADETSGSDEEAAGAGAGDGAGTAGERADPADDGGDASDGGETLTPDEPVQEQVPEATGEGEMTHESIERPESPDPAAAYDEIMDGADTEGPEAATGGASDLAAADDAGDLDGGILDGPQSDQEMPLTAHIEEMMKRLAVVVAIAGVVSLATFPFAERIINFLWYSIMPGVPAEIARPRVYGVLELLFTKLKVASLAGLIIALPALVYQTYQFMRPGLYPHERRYYLAAIPTSLVLALVGVSFAYFIVLPAIFTYFLYYSQDVAAIGFALGRTFNLILVLMGYLALVFQIPLFLMLAMMMGIVTRRWLAARRLLFWGAFLGISFIFSPDPTGMAPVVVALTMVGLFEGTLLLAKWAGRD